MQREALRVSGLEGDYELIRADESTLEAVLDRLRGGDLDGVNVTMPLKQAAFLRSDQTTPEAMPGRTVNTLRHREGRVEGHSTDVIAFDEIFRDVNGPVLVLGSGGSARAALTARSGADAYLSARNTDRGTQLASEMGARLIPWGEAVPGACVVNATPIGMSGELLPDQVLDRAGWLIDLPYGPRETPAVEGARARNISVVDGLEFLGRQAAASFTWWTGAVVDSQLLVAAARNA